MARVSPISFEEIPPGARAEWERQTKTHGRMTNMKRTLARSPEALKAYMKWYGLRDQVEKFLGPRLTILLAHAISSETDCLICSTYFRKSMLDSGVNPDSLVLDDKERAFLDFGRQIARDPRGVNDEVFGKVEAYLGPDELLTVTAFAGLMVATNIINNVLEVDLDDYLESYRTGDTS